MAKSDTADPVLLAAANVPHAALLPHCCAIMHHGGAGTTSAALAAGCPQLVCPLHFDQFQWVRASSSTHWCTWCWLRYGQPDMLLHIYLLCSARGISQIQS